MKDSNGLKYFLTDHLGSVVATLSNTGTLISQQRYLPFGAPRTDINGPYASPTDFGYTGQRKLDSGMGGIMDYKARFYSPTINRFLQPDTLIPSPSNPQNWNRYSYVHNNPIRFNDPTGHYCVGDDEDCIDGGGGTGPVQSGGNGGCNGVPDCGIPETDAPVVISDIDPLDSGLEQEECNINCSLSIALQPSATEEGLGWMDSVLANEWTPLVSDLVQFGATATVAYILLGLGAATIAPALAFGLVALGLIGTIAMIINLASLDYQADHELHGVNRSDFGMSVMTNFLTPVVGGIIPETAAIKAGKEWPKAKQFFFEILMPATSVITDLWQE